MGMDKKKAGGGKKIFVAMDQVFAGNNIALYGLIVSILLRQQTSFCGGGN
jgi:hypothetical protein